MNTHLPEERISALLDHQLDGDDASRAEQHISNCDHCRAVRDGLSAVDRLFRKVEVLEPPAYLWAKISAGLDEAASAEEGWFARLVTPFAREAWVRTQVWALAAALMLAGTVGVLHWSTVRSERRQLAEIDITYQKILPQNAESYNPFATSPQIDTGKNPFRRTDLRTNQESFPPVGKR
jgi:hypothetical protein